MPFVPIVPMSGLSGWNFLRSTIDRQTEIFDQSADIQRDVDYFTENINSAESVDDLISDRRLLKVALGAFGLQDEINKGGFIRKILEEGTLDSASFARRLNNSDYINMATVFSYGNGGFFATDDRVNTIVRQYKDNAFEASLGEVNDNMRLALNFKREIGEIASQGYSETGGWFQVMASLPLRSVVESAFNLPAEFSQIDLDTQVETLAGRSKAILGSRSVDVFQDPEMIETAIRRFHLRNQIDSNAANVSGASIAMTLLSGGIGSAGITNLLLSS